MYSICCRIFIIFGTGQLPDPQSIYQTNCRILQSTEGYIHVVGHTEKSSRVKQNTLESPCDTSFGSFFLRIEFNPPSISGSLQVELFPSFSLVVILSPHTPQGSCSRDIGCSAIVLFTVGFGRVCPVAGGSLSLQRHVLWTVNMGPKTHHQPNYHHANSLLLLPGNINWVIGWNRRTHPLS